MKLEIEAETKKEAINMVKREFRNNNNYEITVVDKIEAIKDSRKFDIEIFFDITEEEEELSYEDN